MTTVESNAISKNTKVTLGLLLTILVAAGGAFWQASTLYSDVRVDLDKVLNDRFTLTAASEQALRHAILNPGVKVPDPRNPGKFFQVEK